MLYAKPGRSGKQQQEQNLPNLCTAFQPSPVCIHSYSLCLFTKPGMLFQSTPLLQNKNAFAFVYSTGLQACVVEPQPQQRESFYNVMWLTQLRVLHSESPTGLIAPRITFRVSHWVNVFFFSALLHRPRSAAGHAVLQDTQCTAALCSLLHCVACVARLKRRKHQPRL